MPKKISEIETSSTKKELANALRTLMLTTHFEKITISDITDACKMHRQTFYYHFQDKYELMDWIINSELIEPFKKDFNLDNMYDKIYTLFDTMYNDKKFYQSVKSINYNDLYRFVSIEIVTQFTPLLRDLAEESNIKNVNENDDNVTATFFGCGISGVIMNWISSGMKNTPEEITESIKHLVTMCKQVAVKRYN